MYVFVCIFERESVSCEKHLPALWLKAVEHRIQQAATRITVRFFKSYCQNTKRNQHGWNRNSKIKATKQLLDGSVLARLSIGRIKFPCRVCKQENKTCQLWSRILQAERNKEEMAILSHAFISCLATKLAFKN